MTNAPFCLDEFLPYRLTVLAEKISREFSRGYKERFGISRAEWRVVAQLSQSGAVSVREIHEKVDMDKSRVSRAAAKLEKEGYVQKQINEQDKRLVDLTLTEQGHKMVTDLAPMVLGYQAELIRRLGPDAEPFLRGMTTLDEYNDLTS